MRIEAPPDIIELRITEIIPSHLPAAGDLRLECKASIDGFAGSGWCWVYASNFEAFATAVEQLHDRFDCTATLASISPGQFSLSLAPANSRGYVLVQISIGRIVPTVRSMAGAFEVDLPALAELNSWTKNPPIDG